MEALKKEKQQADLAHEKKLADEEKKMARKTTASQSNSWSETCRITASNATKNIT